MGYVVIFPSFALLKELREVKRKNAALQMQQFVGEEKNDLLDYLRSLQPEKVSLDLKNFLKQIDLLISH